LAPRIPGRGVRIKSALRIPIFSIEPVILIGAIDNKWALRLTQALRYRIEVANPPGSGSGKEPIASIVDAQNPTTVPTWTTDLSIPFAAWKNDYAIVARIGDATTGSQC